MSANITYGGSDYAVRLVACPVTSDDHVDLLRKLRNVSRTFMTNDQRYITTDEQEQWWSEADPEALSCWLYCIGEVAVGFGLLKTVVDQQWLTLGLAPRCRGLGLGRQIMGHLIQQATKELWLEVLVWNEPAIRLYRAFGFYTTAQIGDVLIQHKSGRS